MANTRIRTLVIVAALILSIVSFAGCTGEPPTEPVPPGVEKGLFGRMEVVGYLAESGGAWTVFDADPNASAGSEPEALVTLVPGSVDGSAIESLDGRYIWASGRSSSGGADIPQIKIDGIDTAVESQ